MPPKTRSRSFRRTKAMEKAPNRGTSGRPTTPKKQPYERDKRVNERAALRDYTAPDWGWL